MKDQNLQSHAYTRRLVLALKMIGKQPSWLWSFVWALSAFAGTKNIDISMLFFCSSFGMWAIIKIEHGEISWKRILSWTRTMIARSKLSQ
jgi:hypothetical protein